MVTLSPSFKNRSVSDELAPNLIVIQGENGAPITG